MTDSMTETLFRNLEEKMLLLFSEVESLRKENASLKELNSSLSAEREKYTKKLQDLVLLFEPDNFIDTTTQNTTVAAMKPVLVQG